MTVLIAAGTWIVTQAQARRAARRDMRVTYLLDAYRRLDRASNRPLTPTSAHDIEAAISDIILLGTATQVSLADEFARAFAAEHSAEAIALLQDLRTSLRRELLLEELPDSRYITLRINVESDRRLPCAQRHRTRSARARLRIVSNPVMTRPIPHHFEQQRSRSARAPTHP